VYGQNGDKPEWRHAQTATDCPDQNGDKLSKNIMLISLRSTLTVKWP